MANDYTITVPIEIDTKGSRERLKKEFNSFRQEIEGEFYKIRITADSKDLDKIKESLKDLKAEDASKINIGIDRASFDKHLQNLKSSAEKNATEIGKTFKKTIQDDFNSLSIESLIEKQFGKGTRYSGARAGEVAKGLYEKLSVPLPDNADYMSIVQMAEAYEQLNSILGEIKDKSPREYGKLGFTEKDIESGMKTFYTEIGKKMSDENVRGEFINQIQTSFTTLSQNIQTLMQSIVEDSKTMFGGMGASASGTSEEISKEVQEIIDEITRLENKMEEARQKLSDYKSKKEQSPGYVKNINGNKVGIDELIKQQEQEIANFQASIQSLQQKKDALMSGKGGGNRSSDGSGDWNGSRDGKGSGGGTGANSDEIKRITNEIEELNSQLDEAKAKLEELKKGTDLTKSLDKNTKSKLLDSLKMDLQTIAEELISLGDKMPIEKAQRFLSLINTYYKLGGSYTEIGSDKVLKKIDSAEEMIYKKFDPDEEGKIEGVELKSYIDSKAIEEQAVVVQQLTDRIKELEKTKERLSSSNSGSGDGAVGTKVPVEPDATGFIGKIQEQIDSSGETVKVKIDVDDSINEIKQKIDDIPSSKEIKLSVVDYDNVPLMADAAGNVQNVFRGTHGVFGNWGIDGVTWFTDELQLATQYADSLAEDGKIIRANLSFKNPLEIFGNGADFDKIDISETTQAVRDMAEKMGFDIKKMLTDDIVQVAKATGYDGVIFRDIKDGYDDLAHNVFAIVDSIQAKNEELYASVYKNTGEIVKLENNGLPGNHAKMISIDENGDLLQQQIQNTIDNGKPYYVNPELDPNSTLAQDIQNSINNIKLGDQGYTETTREQTHEITRPMANGGQVHTISRQSTTETSGNTVSFMPISPTQTFDNEIQQNLVSLENYKNTIAEIDKLKLEPETEETKAKLEELNTLADYFASKITTIRGECGSIDGTFMKDSFTGGFTQRLRSKYTDEQLTQMEQIAGERYGVPSKMEMPQFTKIGSELSNIEAKSEGMRQSLNKSLLESSSYVKQLEKSFIELIQLDLELKVETNKKDIEDYQNDMDEILSKYPQLQQFIDQFSTEKASWEFVKTDKWNDFLATLPQAHEYLKALGYDFEKMNSSAESPISSGTVTSFKEVKLLLEEIYSISDRYNQNPDIISEIPLNKFKNEAQQFINSRGMSADEKTKGLYDKYVGWMKWAENKGNSDELIQKVKQSFESGLRQAISNDDSGRQDWERALKSILPPDMGEFINDIISKQFGDAYKLFNNQNLEKYGTDIVTAFENARDKLKAIMPQITEDLGFDQDIVTNSLNTIVPETIKGLPEFSDALSKICEVLGIEIPKNANMAREVLDSVVPNENPDPSSIITLPEQEQAAGQAAEQMGKDIADGANTGNEAVQRLSESLNELFAKMQNSPKEVLAMFGDSGIVGDIIGRESAVDPEETYRLMISNISKNIFGSLHNHPNLQNVLSADDFNGLLDDSGQFENGMRLSGVLSGDKVKFYDFSDVAKDQMQAFLVNYKEQMSIVRDEVAKQFGAQSFKTMDLNLARSKEFREVLNQRELELESQLLQEGMQSGLFKTNPMKEFNVSDVQGIAQYLLQIQERATAALSPMQQLINLIEFGSEKKLDLGSDEVQNILNAFKSGDLSAIQAFDKLMVNLGSDFHELSLDDELNKFRTSFKELFGQEFYQNNFDVIQEQLEDQIFDQAKTAQEMMVKARELFKEKLSNETPVLYGDTTGTSTTPIPQPTLPPIDTSGAEQAAQTEANAFDSLIAKLTTDVPNAVDTKTQAFRSEQVEVDNLLDLEISKLQELSTELQNVFKDNGDNKNFGVLKELFDLLNSLGETEFKVPNMDELYSSIEKLVQVLGLLQDIHPDTSLTDFIAGLKISKTDVDNIVDLSAALEILGEAIKKLGENGVSSPALNSISDILKQADALKSLATILSSTQEKINSAAKAAGGNSNQDLQELREYNKAVNEYYDAQQRLQTGNMDTKSRDEYVSAKALQIMVMYEEKLNALKESGTQLTDKQTAALENAKQKQEELLKLIDDYNTKRNRSQAKSIKQEVDSMMKGIDSQIEKASLNTRGKNDAYTNKVNDIRNDYISLQELINSIDWDGKSEEQIKELQNYLDTINLKIKDMKKNLAVAQNASEFREANKNQIARVNTQMSSWMSKYTGASEFFPQIKELQVALQEVGSSEDLNNIIQGFERIKAEAADAGKVGKSFGDTLMGSFRNLARYLLSFASFYRIIGVLRQAVGIVKELDSSLMEVRKVTSESLSDLEKWQKSTFDQADAVGGNAKQIQDSTAAWLRLGKSFEESQQAAQASVKLLNVSEFTSIDDATTSLVSMRQAFDDLSYDDFIDKLNGVGDHFSSSTDQLAQGMKNVSSVLKVAGNDIDQSLALLTAANDVTQDMSKASMGVRTVALRISGTQEAKQELEDLGEDISDFVVQTQSKVDAQVRKYTATAENPNGISVLDSSGRLRSTFDILTDISQVYDEIVEKDNKFGTNTSNALLELLAGKTRSNILASILQNPEVLQDAYEQSKNSQGVGQQELDIYLDSIEAKLAKLQNRLQELAAITIDSDWLKGLIDFGTEAIKIVTKLTKQVSGLNLAVGAIGGAFLSKKGIGLAGTLRGFGSGILKSIQNTGSSIMAGIDKRKIFKAQADLLGGKNYYDVNLAELLDINQGMAEDVPMIKEYVDGLSDAERQSMTLGEAVEKNTNIFGSFRLGLGGTLKSLKGFASAIGNTLIIMGAMKGIELLVEAIYRQIKADEIAIEKGKEAKKTISDLNSAYQDQKKYLEENASEYERLSQGVGDNNKNISLSEEEYSKFLEVNNKLADMFPQLVTGFDEQGNAILKLGDGATSASEQLALLLQQEQDIAKFKIGENLGAAIDGSIRRIQQLRDDADDAQKEAYTYQGMVDLLEPSAPQENEDRRIQALRNLGVSINENGELIGFEKLFDTSKSGERQLAEKLKTIFLETTKQIEGIEINAGEFDPQSKFEDGTWFGKHSYNIIGDPVKLTDEMLDKFVEAFSAKVDEVDPSGKLKDALLLKSTDEKEIRAEWNSVVPSIISSLSVYDGYDELGENVKQNISNQITQLDILSLKETDQKFKDALEAYKNGDNFAIRAYFRERFLDPITDLNEDVKTVFDDIITVYYDQTISFTDKMNKVNDLLLNSGITGSDYTSLIDALTMIGIGQRGSYGGFKINGYDYDRGKQISNAISEYTTSSQLQSLTGEEFEIAYNLVVKDEQTFKTFDGLLKKIQEVQDKVKEVQSDTFADLFKDESDTGLKKISETFRETATTISNFRDQLDTGDEGFDPYEMTKSFDEARKAGESYTDYLNRVQLKSLQNFASGYKEAISGLTDPSEIELARQYIMDLFDTFDWERFDIPDIQSQIFGSMDAFQHISSPQYATVYQEQIKSQMDEVLSSQEDYKVFYSLVLTGEDPEELLSNWDDLKLSVELQYKIKDLDTDISNRNQRIARNQAEIDWKDARGEAGSSSLYNAIIEEQQGIVDDYIGEEGKVALALQEWNNRKNNPGKYTENQITKAYTDYLATEADAFNAQKQLLEYQMAQTKSRVKRQEDAIRDEQNTQADLLNKINEEIAERGQASDDLYIALADSYTTEAETQRGLYEHWKEQAEKEDDSELVAEYTKYANDAMSAALTAESNAREQRTMPIQNELTNLQNQMQQVQAEATKMEETITKAETNHQKVSAKTYKDLIANGKKQITNLRNQIGIQKGLQAETKRGSKEWYEYQATIDSLNSDISNMQNNIVGWSETMTSLVSTNAEALSSALSSAFSEMDSGTGMTIDTMNELKKQFSDLKGFNMDNVFYETADGVKMNKSAVEELVDQEYMLQQAILEEALAQENLSATDRVRYEQQLSMLQAIYDQQKANFTGYAEWQTAQSTDNAGKRYEDIQGALKSVQEMYSKGLTGTDDFRSFVSMIDRWGLDTVDAYDRNIEMVKRYVTEDSSGLNNFYSDMVSKGFGTGSASEGFSLNVPNVEEAARAMGMSAEFMNILLSRAEDYGATNNWVESELDGNLKIQDATQKLIEAKTRLAELEQSGADTTAIEDAANVVQFYEQQVQDYVSNTGSVIAREGQITSAQLRSYQAQMQAIVDEMNDTELTQGMTDQQKQAWQNGHLESLKNLAVEAGVEVDWENIDLQESFKQAYPGYLEAPVTPKLTDVDLSATSDNEEVQSVIQGLGDTTKWTDANTELQGYIDSINEFPYEELKTIDMNDGKWDKGYESAEKSLEGIAKMFGLSRKQADQLVEALHEMGAIGQETETYDKNAITTNMSNLADKGYTSDQVMSMTEEERKKVYVDTVVDDTSYEEWKKDVESTTVQAKVQTALDSGKSAQDMLNMSDNALAQTIGIELDTENFDEQIAAARESLQEAATLTVKIDETQFSQLTGAEDVKIGADTSEVTTAIEEAETSVESSNPKMKVGATVGEALSSASHVRDTISSMNPQMTVGIKTDTSGLVSSISNALSNKIFTIKTTQVNVGKKYTGTMLSPAKASGTAYNAPLRMIPAQKAFAQGDVGLKEDEEALVNELGTESLIRDGQWFLIPGGMHVESLKKDDIVLNHLQTADLLKHGKAFGHGKAYAEGSGVPLSSIPLAPAHADRGKTRQNATSSTWNVKQPYTNKTPKDNTTAIKDNTKQLKKNNDTQKKGTSAIDAFKKWLDGWVDWIDNRLDALNNTIDRFTKESENLIGYGKKNKDIQSAMNRIASLYTYQNADVTYTTKANGTKIAKGYKNIKNAGGTLLYDTTRGAVRYQQQADDVIKHAINAGIFGKVNNKKNRAAAEKKAMDLVDKIQTGRIDIKRYNENIREVISSYEDWFGKSQELINNLEEIKQQYKDLEQTKLDNITTQFETLADYASAVSAVSNSFVELATARGTVVNDKNIKNAYKTQMQQQGYTTGYLQKEEKAYRDELKNATKVFGIGSNEWVEALSKYQNIKQALNESETAYRNLNQQLKELDIHKVELVIERLEKYGNTLASKVSLAGRRENEYRPGSIITEKDYAVQLENNGKILQKYWENYNNRLNEIAMLNPDVDSDKYQELYNNIMGDVEAMQKLLETNEDLKDSIVELRWKNFEDFQKTLDNAVSDYEHLQSLMKETQFFDADYGIRLTDRGMADIALIAKMMDTERQKIADYRKALQKLEDDYKSKNITLTKYNETSREYIEIIQQSASAVAGYKDALADLYKTQITNENNLLQENIKLRKDALQQKKSYYDYDKTLKSKNKDLAQLQSQVNALRGTTSQAGQAELARLQAQLKEAQEDMEETQRDHEYDVMQQGFDKLSEDANKILEDTIKHIDAIPEKLEETANNMLAKLNSKYDEAYTAVQQVINETGTKIGGYAEQQLQVNTDSKEALDGIKTASESINTLLTSTILQDGVVISSEFTNKIEQKIFQKQDEIIEEMRKNNEIAKARNAEWAQYVADVKAGKDNSNKTITGNNNTPQEAKPEPAKTQKQPTNTNNNKSGNTSKTNSNSFASVAATAAKTSTKQAIKDILAKGKYHKNKATAAERKTHNALWEHIVDTYHRVPTYAMYKEIAKLLGVKMSKTPTEKEKTNLYNAMKKKGYSKGSKYIDDDELNWLHNKEVVIRKSDGAILQPFNAGDMVFTSKQSENLWKMSQVDPDVIKKMVSDVDMNKFIMPGISDKLAGRTENNNNNQTIHFDSLITINGNADQQTVADLQQIAQGLVNNREFKSNVIKFVTKDMTREAAKAGYRGR